MAEMMSLQSSYKKTRMDGVCVTW